MDSKEKNLVPFENGIINVHCNENDIPMISGRELHKFLEVDTPYHKWFPRMVEYGFEEDKDFYADKNVHVSSQKRERTYYQTDHDLTIPMAKELCMIQRTDKGKIARQYFLQLEEAWNTPEMVMARALKMADKQITKLSVQNEQMQERLKIAAPKEKFADACMVSKDRVKVGQVAKLASKNGYSIGAIRLFRKLREWKVLNSENVPYQQYIDRGYFELVMYHVDTNSGVELKYTPYVTPKGQIYIINRLYGKAV